MQGTIVKVAVSDGDVVEAGDLVVVLEAMKMEQPLNAHKAGTITGLAAAGRRGRHVRRDHLRDQGLTIPAWVRSDCFDRCGPPGPRHVPGTAGRRRIGGWRSVRR